MDVGKARSTVAVSLSPKCGTVGAVLGVQATRGAFEGRSRHAARSVKQMIVASGWS
jgi:hypothetical protein